MSEQAEERGIRYLLLDVDWLASGANEAKALVGSLVSIDRPSAIATYLTIRIDHPERGHE